MQSQPQTDGMVFRRTHAHKGRKIAVTPQNSTMKHLSYGRIILDAGVASASFHTGASEVSLICLSGSGTVKACGQAHEWTRFDSIYIPRESEVEVATPASEVLPGCSAAA